MTFVVSISSQRFFYAIVDHIRDEEQSTSAHFIKISYDDTLKVGTLTMSLNMLHVNRTIGAIAEQYKKEEDIITGCVKLCIEYASDYELFTLLEQIK